jgi:hypothetical protein
MIDWLNAIYVGVHAFYAQLSVAMLIMLLSIFLPRWPFWAQQKRGWSIFLLSVAAIFYPLALGLGRFDPYAAGYDQRLLIVCAGCALLSVWRYPLISIWLTLAAVAHAAQWGESNNLWDYLFDPLAVIWVLLAFMRTHFRGSKHANI